MRESKDEREAIDDLVEKNPNVDAKLLREALTLLDELQKEGMLQPEYNIQSPYKTFPRRASART